MPNRNAITHALTDVHAQLLEPIRGSYGGCQSPYLKELVEQAEIAEKSAKKFEPSTPKGKWGMNNKGRSDMAQSSQAKRKETMSVELSGDVQSKAKKGGFNNQESKVPSKIVLLQRRSGDHDIPFAPQRE